MLEQLGAGSGVGQARRHADAGPHVHLRVRLDAGLQATRHELGQRFGRTVGQDGELVAAEPADQRLRPQPGQQALCDRHQQRVAGVVAAGIVDVLEVVEVDERHAERLAGRHPTVHPLLQDRAVRQPRQGVAGRPVLQLALPALQLTGQPRQTPQQARTAQRDEDEQRRGSCHDQPEVVAAGTPVVPGGQGRGQQGDADQQQLPSIAPTRHGRRPRYAQLDHARVQGRRGQAGVEGEPAEADRGTGLVSPTEGVQDEQGVADQVGTDRERQPPAHPRGADPARDQAHQQHQQYDVEQGVGRGHRGCCGAAV